MASRTPFNSTTVGPITGPSYMDNVKDRIKDLWDTSQIQLTAIGGTANALTATCDPALTGGVTRGMKFTLIPASSNTAAVTIAINGGAPISVIDDAGNALLAGALVAGRMYQMEFTSTAFRVFGTSGSVKVNDYQAFTADGTWLKPAGTPANATVTIQLWGGGGGGANNNTTASSGAGGGGCVQYTCKAGDLASSVAVTIGAGGTVGVAGGTSTFGTLLTAFGGGPGNFVNSNTNRAAGGGGGGGGATVGGTGGANSVAAGSGVTAVGGASGDATAGAGGQAQLSTAGSVTGSAIDGLPGYYGGGGGGGSADGAGIDGGGDGGRSVLGGGGGAGRLGSLGGVSQIGGNGGAPNSAGQAPGGGGGNNAVGARGECRVFVNG